MKKYIRICFFLLDIFYFIYLHKRIELDNVWIVLIAIPLIYGKILVNNWGIFFRGLGFSIFIACCIIIIGGSINKRQEYDYIVVLGNGFDSKYEDLSENAKSRLSTAILMDSGKQIFVVSGGQTHGKFEALYMRQYLIAHGIDSSRIIVESKSQNTYENLHNVYDLIGDKKILIVTNRFHILRSKLIAKNVGFSHISVQSAQTEKVLIPYYYIREIFAFFHEIINYILRREF